MVSSHPNKCTSHSHCGSGCTKVLVCHLISQGNAIKGYVTFVWEPLTVSHHPAKFRSPGIVVVEIYRFYFVT